MNLKELLKSAGVEITDSQAAVLEPLVKVKAKAAKTNAKYVGTGKEFGAKTPLQMKQAVNALGLEEPADIKAWAARLAEYDGFKTQQSPEKVIAFYRKRAIEAGLVRTVTQ